MNGDAPIVLTDGGGSTSIRPENVYFAFPDGRLAYDCVTCGAKCCRNQGFELLAGRELQARLNERHALRFFVDPCASGAMDHFHTRNLSPACFFLNAQNFCSLHVEHGYDAKPEICRLFPFNQIYRAGDRLIVAPHPRLCPLTVLPPGQQSDASRHELLLAAMSDGGLTGHVPDAVFGKVDPSRLIDLERRIVALSESSSTSYAAYAAAQLALTRAWSRGGESAADDERGRARQDIDSALAIVHELLGLAPAPEENPAVVNTMIGATPAIRSWLLFTDASLDEAELERVPTFLTAVHVLAAQARQAGMAQVTYQTIMELVDGYRPLLMLLANVDRVMTWKPDAKIDFAATRDTTRQSRYLNVAKALVPSVQRRARAPLGRILLEHSAPGDVDRILFLKLLARQLLGRLEPMTDGGSGGSMLRHPRATAQQWALGHVSVDLLTTIASRKSRG